MMKLVLVCLLGITGADTLDALAGGTQSGAAEKGGVFGKAAKRAHASLISAETACESEFDACSSESDCRACLEINESEECRRDTDSFHCDETEETLCCIFMGDATCMDNEELTLLTGCLEKKCPSLEVACKGVSTVEDSFSDGGGGDTPLQTTKGNDAIVAGPDAHVNTDAEAVGLANINSGTDGGDGVAKGATLTQATGAAARLASRPSKFAIVCTPALVVMAIFSRGT